MTSKGLVAAKDINEGDMLYSFDNGKLTLQRCQGTEPARKESLKITMRSGRSIVCSYDHPMLTTFGYKRVCDIKTGERIVALHSEVDSNYEIDDDELTFATIMMFEGTCTRLMRYSNTDKDVINEMESACKRLGIRFKQYSYSAKCDFHIMGGESGRARAILEKYGISYHKSYTKRIPKDWFSLSLRQKYKFLDLMFATDGYVAKQSGQLGITLANKELVEDIQQLLASVKIISTIRYKPNKRAGAWGLYIPRSESVKLIDKISFYHKREAAMSLLDKKPVCITDSFPYDIIRKEKMTYRTLCPPFSCREYKEISRDKFVRLSNEFAQLKKYILEDFYYDRVDKIESVGEIDLIHIGVDNTHNYIANGLVSHNTEIAVKNFIAYGLALNPKSKFIHLSYSDDLVLDNSKEINNLIHTEEYQRLFDTRPTSNNAKKWYTEQGGGVYAVSASGQVTGFGAGQVDVEREDKEIDEFTPCIESDFAGAIIIDDPIKPDDALSETIREKVNQKFETTIRNRVNSRNTPIIIIMQRLHEHDLCGYLKEIEPDDWTVISLPCIYQENGEDKALWPFKHTVEELRKIEKANSYVFQTQYMQEPKPIEGLMYAPFRTYEAIPATQKAIRKNYTDTADTGADYLCSICYIETELGNFITDVLYTQKPMEYTEPETAKMLSRNMTEKCIVESNNGGRGFARAVERECRLMNNNYTKITWFHQGENKQVRIFTKSNEVQNLTFFPSDWNRRWPEFYSALTGYRKEGNNSFDDAPDALTGTVEYRDKNTIKDLTGIFY